MVCADIREAELLDLNRSQYDRAYGGDNPTATRAPLRKVGRKYARTLERLERYRRTGRFLEVGCGAGEFLAAARDHGWDSWGVEIAADAATVARVRGLRVHAALLPECGFEDDWFDIVYLNEVLEHVFDPRALLEEIRRVLRPGGALFLRTRNPSSWTVAFCGERWHHFVDSHASFLAPRTFRTILPGLGFEHVSVRTWGASFQDRYPAAQRWRRKLSRMAGKVLEAPSRLLGKGHRIEVMAEKAGRR
jgi:SAM-dependent methyltransferase